MTTDLVAAADLQPLRPPLAAIAIAGHRRRFTAALAVMNKLSVFVLLLAKDS
jgi:hypothetical protein